MKTKKKILSFLILVFLISNTSFSQDITADTTLANIYYNLAREFLKNYELDSSIYYLEKSQNKYTRKFYRLHFLQLNSL